MPDSGTYLSGHNIFVLIYEQDEYQLLVPQKGLIRRNSLSAGSYSIIIFQLSVIRRSEALTCEANYQLSGGAKL